MADFFNVANVNIDTILEKYIADKEYGEYQDYDVYKTYSLSPKSYIDFLEVKINKEDGIPNNKFFAAVVLQEYLCVFEEITPDKLYLETYLEDLLLTTTVKSVGYDKAVLEGKIKEETLPNQEKENFSNLNEMTFEEIKQEFVEKIDQIKDRIPEYNLPDFENDDLTVLHAKLEACRVYYNEYKNEKEE